MINGLNNSYTDITNLEEINATNINSEFFLEQPSEYFLGITSPIQTQIDELNNTLINGNANGGGYFVINGAQSSGFQASKYFSFAGSTTTLDTDVPLVFDFDFKITGISFNCLSSLGIATVKLYKNGVVISTLIVDAQNVSFPNLEFTYIKGDTFNIYCSSISGNNGGFVRCTVSCLVNGIKGDQGIQGNQGIQGISFIWRDEWVSTAVYLPNDVIQYNGSVYVAILQNSNTLPTSTATPIAWNLMVSKGDKGDTGSQGPQGPQGPQGESGGSDAALVATVTANSAAIITLGASVTALSAVVSTQGATIDILSSDVASINTQIGTINEEIIALDGKTQYMTANNVDINTSFASSLSATGDITTSGDIFSRNLFSDGLTTTLGQSTNTQTNIQGSNIYVGSLGSLVYIGGVAFTPFSSASSFFSQW